MSRRHRDPVRDAERELVRVAIALLLEPATHPTGVLREESFVRDVKLAAAELLRQEHARELRRRDRPAPKRKAPPKLRALAGGRS